LKMVWFAYRKLKAIWASSSLFALSIRLRRVS